MGELLVISRDDVAAHLSYAACIPLMRDAMAALSAGRTRQVLRSIIDLQGGRAFGVMPGAMDEGTFGAKLISVFPGGEGDPSHQGVITLFDPQSGAPVAIVDASEVTGIRTAAASAAATDALALPESSQLAILGTGEQALRHAEAMLAVRPIERVFVWGRCRDRAEVLGEALRAKAGWDIEVSQAAEAAVADADIICTTTAAVEPILESRWVKDGAHVNAIGSSRAGPAEIDNALVVRAAFFADHKEGVIKQGGEFLRARDAGLIDEKHILGEIGEVFAGSLVGRRNPADVTVYKSLGSIVQDLVSAWYLFERATNGAFGRRVPF
jgi:ornithine cyclodeaminase/alanine dehydrogenase-like protein (mu-crystallin family)